MRKRPLSLAGTRIYQKRKRYYLFSPEPIQNPATGEVSKWHSLCDVSEGITTAKELAAAIRGHQLTGKGNMPRHLMEFLDGVLKRRRDAFQGHGDPNLERIFREGNKNLTWVYRKIASAFEDFDVDQVLPCDVAVFVDQWEGRRSAVVYKSKLSLFFKWAIRRGLRHDNPCRDLTVEGGKKRKVRITADQFHAIRDKLLTGKKGGKAPAGPMRQCYIDLCYLIFQRVTEIRLLKKSDIRDGYIYFRPTKTRDSSGATVAVPITPEIQAVLDRAAACYPHVQSEYVIHTRTGSAYATRTLRAVWREVLARQGLSGLTQRDIRPMAITDARAAGYQVAQLRVAATHTDEKMTLHYIREEDTPVSEVVMKLPARKQNSPDGAVPAF